MPRAKRNMVNAFNVRAHLSPTSLARVEEALKASPGRLVPHAGLYIPHELEHALQAAAMDVFNNLPRPFRDLMNEKGKAALRGSKVLAATVAKTKRRKVYKKAVAMASAHREETGIRWAVLPGFIIA